MCNGVHQVSPINPTLFDIFMEDVMQEIKRESSDDNLWYKLYADDLVLVIPKHNLRKFNRIAL
jgi:hypothetical protein